MQQGLVLIVALLAVAGAQDDAAVDQFFRDIRAGERYKQRSIPLPIKQAPDPNPNPFVIPAGAPTLKFGMVIGDPSSSLTSYFHTLVDWGASLSAYFVNQLRGGFFWNGTLTYLEPVVLYGGPDCTNLLITYDYLMIDIGVDFVFTPVNAECPDVALLGQIRGKVVLNAVDYTAAYLAQNQIPGLAFNPYYNASLIYSSTGDINAFAYACLAPAYGKGARTYAVLYDPGSGGPVVPYLEGSAAALGMRAAINNTVLDPAKQLEAEGRGQECSYLDPFLDAIVGADPDFWAIGFSDGSRAILICLHKRLYQPRQVYFITGPTPSPDEAWHFEGVVYNNLMAGGTPLVDPIYGTVEDYTRTHVQLFGTSYLGQISYGAGVSALAGTVVSLLNNTSTRIDDLPAYLDQLNTTTLTGPNYLETGGAGKVIHRTVYGQQRNAGVDPVDATYPIYPPGTPSIQQVRYPVVLNWPQEWLDYVDSLRHHRRVNSWQIALIVVGCATVLLIAGTLVLFLFFRNKFEMIFIPKKDLKGAVDEWNA